MIKLTTHNSVVYIQADNIVVILGNPVYDTVVYCKDQRQFEVKETPDEVFQKMEDYYMNT